LDISAKEAETNTEILFYAFYAYRIKKLFAGFSNPYH
jgi:hypothetical protein